MDTLDLYVPFEYRGPLGTFWTLGTFRYILDTLDLEVTLNSLDLLVLFGYLGPLGRGQTSDEEYHKMDTNEYPNIFGCHIIFQTNI